MIFVKKLQVFFWSFGEGCEGRVKKEEGTEGTGREAEKTVRMGEKGNNGKTGIANEEKKGNEEGRRASSDIKSSVQARKKKPKNLELLFRKKSWTARRVLLERFFLNSDVIPGLQNA